MVGQCNSTYIGQMKSTGVPHLDLFVNMNPSRVCLECFNVIPFICQGAVGCTISCVIIIGQYDWLLFMGEEDLVCGLLIIK